MGIVQNVRNLNLDNKNVIKSAVDEIIMILWNVSYLINKGNLDFNLQNLQACFQYCFCYFLVLIGTFYWHFCCCFDICCILYTMLSEGAGQA